VSRSNGCGPQADGADLGDFIVVLLAGTLAGLRDRLYKEGYAAAGDLVEDLIGVADSYLAGLPD
jgi:hypothetical protein